MICYLGHIKVTSHYPVEEYEINKNEKYSEKLQFPEKFPVEIC